MRDAHPKSTPWPIHLAWIIKGLEPTTFEKWLTTEMDSGHVKKRLTESWKGRLGTVELNEVDWATLNSFLSETPYHYFSLNDPDSGTLLLFTFHNDPTVTRETHTNGRISRAVRFALRVHSD